MATEGMLYSDLVKALIDERRKEMQTIPEDTNFPGSYEVISKFLDICSSFTTYDEFKTFLISEGLKREQLKQNYKTKEEELEIIYLSSAIYVVFLIFNVLKVGWAINNTLPDDETISVEALKHYSKIVGSEERFESYFL